MSLLLEQIKNFALFAAARGDTAEIKHRAEFSFWRGVARRENGHMTNHHYEWFYTDYFSLTHSDYSGRRVLDVGCGPRGSLEWATMANKRVGLDPLVDQYRELGIASHKMEYVKAGSEKIPFPDAPSTSWHPLTR